MEHRWYAIQTTAGHENKVRSLVQRKIDGDVRPPEERPIRQALVPTQEVVEIKNGKKVTVERKLYPGYVLVEMDLNQETAHVVNGIQGVIKFVGHDSRFPQPLRPDEVNRLLGNRRSRPRKTSRARRFRSSSARQSRSPKDRSPISTVRWKR